MTAASLAAAHTKKLVKMGLSLFRKSFNSAKCKTAAKMAVARIKLLRNKREVVVKQTRRDIASLLQSGQDATARIRVEHVIREQNILAANEIVELFCELVVARLSIIAKQRDCPADLKEGIASLIFAAPRCSEIPELGAIRDVFEKKYGKDFVSAATDLRPNCGVNRLLIDKLSVRTPTGEVKLKIMKEIAKEYQIEWDTTESEKELLKPPEEPIKGPSTFVSASSLPVKTMPDHSEIPNTRLSNVAEKGTMQFKDTASAAEAAAKSAKQAIAAAQAAALLANRNTNPFTQSSSLDNNSSGVAGTNDGLRIPCISKDNFMRNDYIHQSELSGRLQESWRYDTYHNSNSVNPDEHDEETRHIHMNGGKAYRRHSYNVNSANSNIKFDETTDEEMRSTDIDDAQTYRRRHSYNYYPPSHVNIKFDESDSDEDALTHLPPARPPPRVPSSLDKESPAHRVHPKLPDYDELAARFESLKYRK